MSVVDHFPACGRNQPRRFVPLSKKKTHEWLSSDLPGLDLLVIQIDGLHVGDHVFVAAVGIDAGGVKHTLAAAARGAECAFRPAWMAVDIDRDSS